MNMTEFLFRHENYIKHDDLKEFEEVMMEFDFMPETIVDLKDFGITFFFLLNLTEKAPNFIQAYEYALKMLSNTETKDTIVAITKDFESKMFAACFRVAEMEDIFNKQVPWSWHENRPLIRGLYRCGESMWQNNEFEKANELFSKIFNTNKNDNIGARYSVKATAEKMTYNDFEKKFTILHEDGSSFYNSEELGKWFGKE